MKKRAFGRVRIGLIIVILCLVLAATALAAPGAPTSDRAHTIILKPQQSIMVQCVGGDELIIAPGGDLEAELTCRVWVR